RGNALGFFPSLPCEVRTDDPSVRVRASSMRRNHSTEQITLRRCPLDSHLIMVLRKLALTIGVPIGNPNRKPHPASEQTVQADREGPVRGELGMQPGGTFT